MKGLRQIIQGLILEIYEMQPEDEKELIRRGLQKGGMQDIAARKFKGSQRREANRMNKNLRRALGRQSKEEIQKDRESLQRIHNSSEYHEIVDAFLDGSVTAVYSIDYRGTYTKKSPNNHIPTWLKKYGKQNYYLQTLHCVSKQMSLC